MVEFPGSLGLGRVQIQVVAILKFNKVLLDQCVHPVLIFQDDLSDDAFLALERHARALLGNLGEDENGHRSGGEWEQISHWGASLGGRLRIDLKESRLNTSILKNGIHVARLCAGRHLNRLHRSQAIDLSLRGT
ncbi:hypothetical protein Y886_26240 [Xanthomonas hyacinthi DSM 19077]|nr:hypothetical protein Y886_26240 [Xanthomonas hyacinthi DSM 19077]